jgi:hypothetical protein
MCENSFAYQPHAVEPLTQPQSGHTQVVCQQSEELSPKVHVEVGL